MRAQHMLTQERLKELLDYDPDTGLFTWKISPRRNVKQGDVAGCTDRKGYICIKADKQSYMAHRLVWLYLYGEWPEDQIDHINNVKSDNRVENLRPATNTQNMRNKHKPSKSSKSKLLGAFWAKQGEYWFSQIRKGGQYIRLGKFSTPIEAHVHYLKAKCSLYPEFVLTDEEKKRIKEFDRA